MAYLHIGGGVLNKRKIWFNPKLDIRPTSASVRETLFSWLHHNLWGYSCLDLFAGSGILSWEALSWGAARVCLVERKKHIYYNLCTQIDVLQAVLQDKDIQSFCMDALVFLAQRPQLITMDLIFLDAPYRTNYLIESLVRLHHSYQQKILVTSQTLIYYETDVGGARKIENMAGFIHYKSQRRGQIYFGLLRCH